jgi:hypothetical protein
MRQNEKMGGVRWYMGHHAHVLLRPIRKENQEIWGRRATYILWTRSRLFARSLTKFPANTFLSGAKHALCFDSLGLALHHDFAKAFARSSKRVIAVVLTLILC